MRMLDLFSGIGGFSLAASWVWGDELEIIGFVEIDKFCQKILKKHWSNVPIYEDIKNVKGEQFRAVELITGGFPCQNISIAGKREGLSGTESGLFWEMARVIEQIKPTWFIIENVPGLYSSNGGKDIWVIITTLEKFGYCVCWKLLNAQYFGVAQRRKRVFFVGSFGNTSAYEVLFEQESGLGHDQKKQKVGPRGLCISTRDGERNDPTNETLIAHTIRDGHDTAGNTTPNNIVAQTIGATQRGNTSFVWQDTYIAEINANRKRKVDGIPGKLDSVRGKALGNAIVPQVVYPIMKAIKEIDEHLR